MESLSYAHITKPRLEYLIIVSASPRNGILNQPTRNYLVIISEIICMTNFYSPLKEGDLATTSPFLQVCLPFSHSLLPINVFHLYSSLELLFIYQVEYYLIHESLNKASKIFKIYSVECCFFTAHRICFSITGYQTLLEPMEGRACLRQDLSVISLTSES